MKRIIPEVNAGSMADIAFLLLVFFLLVTKLDDEKGLLVILPSFNEQHPEPFPSQKRNVLELWLHADASIMVEGQKASLRDLNRMTRDFYTNSGMVKIQMGKDNLPERTNIERSVVEFALDSLRSKGDSSSQVYRKYLGRLDVLENIGEGRLLPANAAIYLRVSDAASFDDYIAVIDELKFVNAQLRDSLALSHFSMTMDQLEDAGEMSKIRALATLVPRRLVEHYQD